MATTITDRVTAIAAYLACGETLRHGPLLRAELRETLADAEIDPEIARALLQLAEAEFLDHLEPWFAAGGAGADPMRLLPLRNVAPERRIEALAFIRRNSRMPGTAIARSAIEAAILSADADFLAHVLDLYPDLHPGTDVLSRDRLANDALKPGPCWEVLFARMPLIDAETDRFAGDLVATQCGRGIALLLSRGYDFGRRLGPVIAADGDDWIGRLKCSLASAHGRLRVVGETP